MKKRLIYLAWFGFAVLVGLMSAGLYASAGTTSSRWLVYLLGAVIVGVCALIGVIFPDKMTRLFFGNQKNRTPGQHRTARTMILDKLHGRENED